MYCSNILFGVREQQDCHNGGEVLDARIQVNQVKSSWEGCGMEAGSSRESARD